MSAPQRDRRQTTYSTSLVLEAKRMYDNGESWTPSQIRDYLNRTHHLSLSLMTVRRWVVPGAADEQRRLNLESYHRRTERQFAVLERAGDDRRHAFVRRLAAERVPKTSIAKVCTVVFGEPWTRGRVVKVLNGGATGD